MERDDKQVTSVNAVKMLEQISDQVDKQQYSNALAIAHDLCKELHLLWSHHVRYYQESKGSE